MSTTWPGSELWRVPSVRKANSDGLNVEDVPKSYGSLWVIAISCD